MKIITKYVLKEHIGPFFFSLSALTSLMLIQYIAKKFSDLVGKGLPAHVIAEFFVLSIPFTVAMTLPMGVLVAVLFAFSRFGSENEITALKAGGVSTRSLMYPVLLTAFGLSLVMLWFNDQVLPEANHTLEVLQTDIIRTKPSFALREQVINPVQERVYLRAAHIDQATSRMQDVIIYDLSDVTRRRTIIGKRGLLEMAPNMSDLALTLYDGVIVSVPTDHSDQLDRVYFTENRMLVKNVANSFQESSAEGAAKGDREMSVCEMQQQYAQATNRADQARAEYLTSLWLAAGKVGREPDRHPQIPVRGIGYYYCSFTTALSRRIHGVKLGVKTAAAAELPGKQQQAPPKQQPPATKAPQAPAPQPQFIGQAPPGGTPGAVSSATALGAMSALTLWRALAGTEARYAIEIEKKFSLAAACVVLAFVGAPIALRFPRGGVGLVIGVSFTIFALYYVCLIGGESLANNLVIAPFWAMWAANAIFGGIGLILFARMGYESGTGRGGGAGETPSRHRSLVRAPSPRKHPSRESSELMIKRLVWPLDYYVFSEFWKIFMGTALGFPVLLVVIDLTDSLQKYLDRKIPGRDIALSYVYYLPDSAFQVLPAAVLFATVFSIGAFTRHSEITAAKASGISFYRLVLPILLGALIATGLDLGLGELAPTTSRLRNELIGEQKARVGTTRFNFAVAAEYGRVYTAAELRTDSGTLRALQIERKGSGIDYPTYVIAADSARYDSLRGRWTLRDGELNVIPDTGINFAISFKYARDRHLTEHPADLMANAPDPKEMRYKELSRFIVALERSGTNANKLRVDLSLKIAIPVTCIIIALFGAPLATSTQRGGTAYGVAISLATTVVFLIMIQLTEAIGSSALIPPDLAAWIPGVVFGVIGLVLMTRVRT